MPTYSYHCETGNHDFDIVQRFSDDALTVCPECGGSVRRVIQPVGVVFKGSGWYITDSRKGSGDSDSSRSNGKSSSKTDSSGDSSSTSSEKATASSSSEKSTAKAAD
jgi:putative FmdB family regulatory protein